MDEDYELEFEDDENSEDEEEFRDPWGQTFDDYLEEQNRKGTPGSMGY